MFSRNFVKKYVRVNLRNFYYVSFAQCRKTRNFPTIFLQKFRQSNFFTKHLYCKSIWRKNFKWGKIYEIFTLYLTKNFFHQINTLVTYLVKPLLSRNFCQKCMREHSRNFHTDFCTVEK